MLADYLLDDAGADVVNGYLTSYLAMFGEPARRRLAASTGSRSPLSSATMRRAASDAVAGRDPSVTSSRSSSTRSAGASLSAWTSSTARSRTGRLRATRRPAATHDAVPHPLVLRLVAGATRSRRRVDQVHVRDPPQRAALLRVAGPSTPCRPTSSLRRHGSRTSPGTSTPGATTLRSSRC